MLDPNHIELVRQVVWITITALAGVAAARWTQLRIRSRARTVRRAELRRAMYRQLDWDWEPWEPVPDSVIALDIEEARHHG